MALSRYGHEATSVFDLLGRGEVNLTAALGWAIEHSPALASALWSRLDLPGDLDGLEVALEVADDQGRTDLELRTASVTVVVEAKKGWLLPGETQLLKYVGRFDSGVTGVIVTLSDSSPAWARLQMPAKVDGVPVVHLPWDGVRAALRDAKWVTTGAAERLWLDQFSTYLAGATAVRDPSEQWVYVVSGSSDKPVEGGPHSNIDFVRTLRAYAHPFGKGWPKRPPVLMGFRWHGRLQQVNRVMASEVVPSLHARWPEIPVLEGAGPYAVYDLGPDIPVPPVPSTGIVRARRLWALLDQLLTQPTIVDAERASKALTAPPG